MAVVDSACLQVGCIANIQRSNVGVLPPPRESGVGLDSLEGRRRFRQAASCLSIPEAAAPVVEAALAVGSGAIPG